METEHLPIWFMRANGTQSLSPGETRLNRMSSSLAVYLKVDHISSPWI